MIGAVILLPILWGTMISVKTRVDGLSMPPRWIFVPTIANYRTAFIEGGATRTLANSFTIALASSIIAVLIALPAAYWVSRTRSRKRHSVLVGAMTTRLAPATVLALPLFLVFARLGLLDTYLPIILVHAGVSFAPAIWLLTVSLDRIPTAIDDASFLDGDRPLTFLLRQVLPMSRSAIIVTLSFCFVISWNEFFLALMLTGYDTRPFSVAVSALMTPHGTYWGEVMAICTAAILPGALLAMLGARYVTDLGDTTKALKQ
jgi:multiple sugar transport system permease protein